MTEENKNETKEITDQNELTNPLEQLEQDVADAKDASETVLDGNAVDIEDIPAGIPNIETKESTNKPLNTTNSEEAAEATSDLEVFGNPDAWVLLSKASSESGDWMKSTKVMDVGAGFLVQVTTQLKGDVAEAVTFVPGVKIGTVGGFKTLVAI